ncbi:MAG: hypothetical protein LBV45_06790 [Xanthomonadaceae bacterium]|nr:hypothetical protein [Xanthomonadaceae bacterium]
MSPCLSMQNLRANAGYPFPIFCRGMAAHLRIFGIVDTIGITGIIRPVRPVVFV